MTDGKKVKSYKNQILSGSEKGVAFATLTPLYGMNSKKLKEGAATAVFALAACVSILAVALICIFLFANGIPGMSKIGILNFITGTAWKPGNNIFGIMPMILGSIYVTAGALIIGVPAGILTAMFLSRFASASRVRILQPAVALLAGIPSVVYGFFGLIVIVPAIREVFGGSGTSMLAASILLGIMILPTIITISESALNAAPQSYYEGALALGATHERAVFKIILPAAKSGVTASIILGVGRAIGEAMAVMMVAGNQARLPEGIFKGVRTLTSNIVMEMGYAADLHREALIATAVVLFVFILIINMLFSVLNRRVKS
ncbi:MAG: Phosphate transport system permease protein PstC [Firmicutes bacterium ADurb.Bin373]|nr:MAG: Phosphate transport system permease protein PstC [Firmicutes bacterium ADurb.Bin373]